MALVYRNLSDEDLVHQVVLKQDKEAYAVLFSRYKHLVLGVFLKYFSDEKTAKEMTQAVFQKIWMDNHLYQVAKFKPWLFRIVKDICVIELKKKGLPVPKEALVDNDDIEWWNYFRLKSKEEDVPTKITNCLKKLEAEQYKCIYYFYLEDKNFQEIADLTGFSTKEVRNFIKEGRTNLKLCLQTSAEEH